jgi:tRNA1(Val) A37 N6-methylase TrmN6
MTEADMTDPHTAEPDTTTDAFLGGQLRLHQPKRGYRAGIDPVLLAAACTAAPGARILDCGAGVGTAGLCAVTRLQDTVVVLVERAAAYVDLARANIAANGLVQRANVIAADLTAPLAQAPELAALANSFDHALANPPYQTDTDGTRSTNPLKDQANAMAAGDLDQWLRFMAAMLKPGGTATLVHRADALVALLDAMSGRFGALSIRPIYPRPDAAAHRVIVSGIKGSRAPLCLQPGTVLHPADGSDYLPDIEAILRSGAAFP